MNFRILEGALSPADGEMTVRTYHSTTLSSGLLGLKAEGYLAVTNLRVIFYATGNSFVGNSILQSEVPLADVSGISSYKGAHFSIPHLVTAAVASFIVAGLTSSIIGVLITGVLVALRSFDLAPFAPLIFAVLFLIASTSAPREKIRRSILATCGATFLFGIGGLGLLTATLSSFGGNSAPGALGAFGFVFAAAAAIYALICYFWYARRPTMSLAIGSKGGSSTPIAISGISGFGLFSGTALRALSAEPAIDVDAMIKELGAMIYDLQVMGGDGVTKWRAS